MQTDISNVPCLNLLIPLSKNTDVLCYEHNCEDEQISNWLSLIKETAWNIIKNPPIRKSGSSNSSTLLNNDLPNLVKIIKGENKNGKLRISTLLAEVQKDHVQHNKRKSRQSLRKIVLGKKSKNTWQITSERITENTNSTSSITNNDDTSDNITNVESQSHSESPRSRKATGQNLSENSKSSNYFTPIQNKEILVPNTNDTVLHAQKKNLSVNNIKQLSSSKSVEILTPSVENNYSASTDTYETPSAANIDISQGHQESDIKNQTIVLDSATPIEQSKNKKTPSIRLKRKSSIQLSQENVKKSKATTSGSHKTRRGKQISEESNLGNQSSNKVKALKNAVIQPNASNILIQQNVTPNEKRILREIQKKEEIVNQNTKKLRSIRQMKIEESKKTRELKMEKAMQQRMKMEKEKEERLRSRTHSRQENQKESTQKKTTQKRQQQEEKISSANKGTPISSKKKKTTSSSNVAQSQTDSIKKAPPKPVRSYKAAKQNENNSEEPGLRNELNKTFCAKAVQETPPEINDTFVKPTILNATTVIGTPITKTNIALTSTPVANKNETKTNISKTPISSNSKRPTTYAMTPTETSFVNYDISEIKSDDDDEEEEAVNSKPIPPWASGIRLKSVLLNQHYNTSQTNIDLLFGNVFETPNLEEIMGVQKKQYFKRTSSAIWKDSPNR